MQGSSQKPFGAVTGLTTQRSRAIVLGLAAVLFAGSTALMFSQETWHDPYRPPSGLAWWLMPRNPPEDLTEVGAHLRAVWALPDNQHVWAGGDYATLLHSHDEGRTWSQISVGDVPAPQPTSAPPNKLTAPSAKKPEAIPNPAPFGISLNKAPDLPPAQNPAAQMPLNAGALVPQLPYGIANPSVLAAGSTVRLQITTSNFAMETANASIDSNLIKLGAPQFTKDPSILILTVTVDPKTPPGPYTIKFKGVRLPKSTIYELPIEFMVVASSPKSAAGLFSLIPNVYAAEPPPGAQGSAPVASIVLLEFKNEKSGHLSLASGVSLETSDGGGKWRSLTGVLSNPSPGFCRGAANSASQCWGSAVLFSLQGFKTSPPLSPAAWQALFAFYPNRVWIGGTNGTIFAQEGGSAWQSRNAPTKARINGLFFQSDGKRGWAVGSSGAILSTADGGQHWTPRTKTNDAPYHAPYTAGPPPW